MFRDRAGVVATAVTQIFLTAPQHRVRQEIENYLRDELANFARDVAAKCWEPPDAK